MRRALIAALAALVVPAAAFAQSPARNDAGLEAIAPLLPPETMMIIRIRFNKAKIDALKNFVARLDNPQASQLVEDVLSDSISRFVALGGQDIYMAIGPDSSPRLSMIPLPENVDVEAIRKIFRVPDIAEAPPEATGEMSRIVDDVLVVAGRDVLENIAPGEGRIPTELTQALQAGQDAAFVVAFAPSAQFLEDRVVQAMPQLPPPLGGGSTAPLTKVQQATLGVRFEPTAEIRVEAHLPDAAAARELQEFITQAQASLANFAALARLNPDSPMGMLANISPAIRPAVEGRTITVRIHEQKLVELTRSLVAMQLQAARAIARLSTSGMNISSMLRAAMVYQMEHEQQWPDSLEELAREMELDQRTLVNPRRPDLKVGYVYRKPAKNDQDAPRAVIWEKFDDWPGRVQVGLTDGSVRVIEDRAEFKKLTAEENGPNQGK